MSVMRVWPSGNLIDPMNPDPEQIEILDIAYALAGINRYGGHSRLTVAQHCVEMANCVIDSAPEGRLAENVRLFALECLMHDAAEYILGDMVRPIKNHTDLGAEYKVIEDWVQDTIRHRFGVTNRYSDKVDDLDKRMCLTEQRDLFGASGSNTLPLTIHPWTSAYAEHSFVRCFFLLRPESVPTTGKASA